MVMMGNNSHYDYLILNFNFYLRYIKMTDKTKVIDDIYKHPIIGYVSTKSTYKEAKSINNEITLNDVKE